MAGCPSCHPVNSVTSLKETQSTDPNHWSAYIFFIYHRTPDWRCFTPFTLAFCASSL